MLCIEEELQTNGVDVNQLGPPWQAAQYNIAAGLDDNRVPAACLLNKLTSTTLQLASMRTVLQLHVFLAIASFPGRSTSG